MHQYIQWMYRERLILILDWWYKTYGICLNSFVEVHLATNLMAEMHFWSKIKLTKKIISFMITRNPVGLNCRIHQLHLCRGIRTSLPLNDLDINTKWSDGEAPLLELWGMWSIFSLPLGITTKAQSAWAVSLWRSKTLTNECLIYYAKLSDGEVLILELWGM